MVSPEVGLKLDQVGLDVLGSARRIVVTKDNTTMVDGGGESGAVEDRVSQIKREIDASIQIGIGRSCKSGSRNSPVVSLSSVSEATPRWS